MPTTQAVSCPGLTRASMRSCNRKKSYDARTLNLLMDPRVKPGGDTELVDAASSAKTGIGCSIALDTGALDDRLPLHRLRRDELVERVRPEARDHEASRLQRLLHI